MSNAANKGAETMTRKINHSIPGLSTCLANFCFDNRICYVKEARSIYTMHTFSKAGVKLSKIIGTNEWTISRRDQVTTRDIEVGTFGPSELRANLYALANGELA